MSAEQEQGPVEHPAFAGRPPKEPAPNTTFAERAAARKAQSHKAIQTAENKTVEPDHPARKGRSK